MQQNILAYTMIIKAIVNERLTNVHLLGFGTQNSSRCRKRLGLLVLAETGYLVHTNGISIFIIH